MMKTLRMIGISMPVIASDGDAVRNVRIIGIDTKPVQVVDGTLAVEEVLDHYDIFMDSARMRIVSVALAKAADELDAFAKRVTIAAEPEPEDKP